MKKLEELLEWGGIKKDVTLLVISGIALLLSIFKVIPRMPFDIAWVAIILCGVPIILEAVIGLVTAFDIKADVLVSLALIASICIHEDFAAGEVAFIMQLGALLEDLTVARAQAGIEKLVKLTPQTARVIDAGRETIIPAEQVKIGSLLRVLPGETIPVDGVIVSGQTSINQAVMTGESLPVDKGAGDEVSSGTVNQFGAFEMKATKVGENSSIRRMIRLVQSADAGKARIVGLADRWATWIVVTALTVGVPKVVLAQSVVDAYSDEEIYAFAASAEKKSEHPLGKAIIRCFKSDIGGEIADAGEFTMIPGQGVKADINGKVVCAGNDKLMIKEKIQITEQVKDLAKEQIEKGTSIIYVAVDGMLCGLLALADSLRDESADMIKRLGEIGIVPVLITGDNREAANQIAGEVGISDVHANCLPEDKLGIIDTYQKNKELVCMIGDGVNDAPALKIAAVGIAMGGVGSDIAVDAADIALVDDEVRELPYLFSLSHRMMTKIKFNLSFSMLLNFVAIVLAMTGILNPVVGALVHNAGSVFVIVNSAFLLKDERN